MTDGDTNLPESELERQIRDDLWSMQREYNRLQSQHVELLDLSCHVHCPYCWRQVRYRGVRNYGLIPQAIFIGATVAIAAYALLRRTR